MTRYLGHDAPGGSERRRARLPVLEHLLAVGLVLAAVVAGAAPASAAVELAQAPDHTYTMFSDDQPTSNQTFPDRNPVQLGTRFRIETGGVVLGIRYFRTPGDDVSHLGTLWSSDGEALGRTTFPASDLTGWQYAPLGDGVAVRDETYTVSYHTSSGYAAESRFFSGYRGAGPLSPSYPSGVFSYGSPQTHPRGTYESTNYWVDPVFEAARGSRWYQEPAGSQVPTPKPMPTPKPTPTVRPTVTPKPTPTAAPVPSSGSDDSDFPGPSNTGVPAGVTLTKYTGPMTVTQAGTVIDSKLIDGRIVIAARDVTISRSRVEGNIDSDSSSASVSVVDSTVVGDTGSAPAIGYRNVTVLRSDVSGGKDSVNCGQNCRVEKSWLHDQTLPSGQAWHNQAYLSNGGSNVTLIGNTLQCSPRDNSAGGGCTADLSLFGDFSAISNVTVDGNLFKATPGGYCGTFGYNRAKPFGPAAADIRVVNNVFERGDGGKCGYWGAVTGFPSGNEWSDNTWVGGGLIAGSTG